jgi:hypothetical protein
MNARVTVKEARFYQNDWQVFFNKHEAWARAHTDAGGILLCLPPTQLRSSLALFLLNDAASGAETDFVNLCQRHAAIGWRQDGPLKYRWLSDPLPLPPADAMAPFLELGWTQDHINAITQSDTSHENVLRRWQASAGRLVSSHQFLKARDQVRQAWASLPLEDRPPLPLRSPSAVAKLLADPKPNRIRGKQARFWKSFGEFCRSWQIAGMSTWELPEPDGPKWPQLAARSAESNAVQIHSPWHYPVHRGDAIGEIAVQWHAQDAANRGVDDHGSWETYALLLPLAHWESVLVNRYPKQRVRAFKTKMEPVIAAILEISDDRLQKLRKTLKALQAGRASSLRGRR